MDIRLFPIFPIIGLVLGVLAFICAVSTAIEQKKLNYVYYDSSRAMDIIFTCKNGFIFAITDKGGIVQVYGETGRPLLCQKEEVVDEK